MSNEYEALVGAVAVLKAVRSGQSPQSYDLTGCIERAEAALATPSPSTDTPGEPYLVWSNEHRAWWGPNHCGYTRHIDRAGRYERSEALRIAGTRDGGWRLNKGNPDEIALPERDAVEQYADITAALGGSHD